jgi:hypothetical protein
LISYANGIPKFALSPDGTDILGAETARHYDVQSLPKGVLIIRGSSGWARKMYKN